MVSLVADVTLDEDGEATLLGGLRLYFGQDDKPLIRRHREDDPGTLGRGETIISR